MSENVYIIALHIGAGYYSTQNRPLYEKLCRKACEKAFSQLKEGHNAIEAVVAAVSELEDSDLTNAGIGSNLTEDGCVECDASVMDGDSLNWGAVGAITRIKNPIQVAKEVLLEQKKGLSLGRIAPCLLSGQGALDWALKHGFQLSTSIALISKKAAADLRKYKKKVEDFESRQKQGKKRKLSHEDKLGDCNEKPCTDWSMSGMDNDVKWDTVGAVALDAFGNVASAVSSGGIILKHSGRIGQAGSYGAGCWAENGRHLHRSSLAITTTGGGEHLIKTLFAKECASILAVSDNAVSALHDAFRTKFLDSPYLQHLQEKFGGALVLKHDSDSSICELLWAHTTRNLCLSFMSNAKKRTQVIFSQLPGHLEAGRNIHVEGTVMKVTSR